MAVAACLLFAAPAPAAIQNPGDASRQSGPTTPGAIEGLDQDLSVVVRASARAGAREGLRSARRHDLVVAGESLRVEVGAAAKLDDARTAIASVGGKTELVDSQLIQALVPLAALRDLADEEAIEFVRAPIRLEPQAVAGEGVGVSGAGAWHSAGWQGQGTKVVVIDIGFRGVDESVDRGDLPDSLQLFDSGCGETFDDDQHGTGTAEIVHEMAPQAELILVCVINALGIDAALSVAQNDGTPVASMSIGNFFGRGDGTNSDAGASVAEARAGGVLPVVSAGNHAQKHWAGSFTSASGTGLHDFATGPAEDIGNDVIIQGGAQFCGFLRWDNWPTTSLDFELELRNTSNVVVEEGAPIPPGNQPMRRFCFTNFGPTALFYLDIFRQSGASSPRLDLFYDGAPADMQYRTVGSITEPASSPSAFTIAAICWQSSAWEEYSSLGPTIDGRTEPDIAGQAAVSSDPSVYGPFSVCNSSGFTGTSAAAPHVAGAAALVKGAFPSYNAGQLQGFLEGRAINLEAPGKDIFTGWGKLDLGTPPQAGSPGPGSGGGSAGAGAAAPTPPPPVQPSDSACGGVRFKNSKRVPVYARAVKIRFAFRASTRCRVTVFLRSGNRAIGRATALLEPTSGVNPPSRRVTIRINAAGRRLVRRPGTLRTRLTLVQGAAVKQSGRKVLVQQTIRLP